MVERQEGLAKPFVKWAGGKRQLLPAITAKIPWPRLDSKELLYVEPFVGGGAVLFAVLASCPAAHALANDANPRLIGAYRAVQRHTEALIARLASLEAQFLSLDRADRAPFYLDLRARFNAHPHDATECAALLLFLNRTCFNGLYRENAAGDFNVPYGKVTRPRICDAATLRADAHALRHTTITCGDFSDTLGQVGPRQAFFYLDPPYKPISQTASFNAYTKTPFDDAEQTRLAAFCKELHRRGHLFLLSNSDPGGDFFERLYDGFRIERVRARRSVNANPAKRGPLDELLISNFDPTETHHD